MCRAVSDLSFQPILGFAVKVKLRNVYLALKGQLPWKRFYRNFFVNGNGWGLFSKNSHFNKRSGRPKVVYDSLASARKAADALGKKRGVYFSAFKCLFCDGYHIGRNRNDA